VTNFSVVRLKRDVLRRSNVGLIATRRAPTGGRNGTNLVFGGDVNLALFRSLTINGYYARTQTAGGVTGAATALAPTVKGDQSSYRGRFNYAGDRYGLDLEHVLVGDQFNPEIGFIRRGDFRRSTIAARFSPRPKSSRIIRKWNWDANYDYITDSRRTRVENRQASGTFQILFENSDELTVNYTHDFEYLPRNFQIAPNVVVPIGGYTYETTRAMYELGQQHRVSGRMSVAAGSFYDGNKKEVTFSSGRIVLSRRVNVEPGMTLNWIDLPQGDFTTRLITARAIFTPTPRALVSSLLQYNHSDHTLSSSVRLRWEYTPGSELFIVYSEGRDTWEASVPGLLNRSVAIKLTRLLRF
jgi:hypothetical protein